MKLSKNLITNAVAFSLLSTVFADDLIIKGDVRLRSEIAIQKDKDTRDRDRLRARVALTKKVNQSVDIGVALISGGNDPISGNQTMNGYGSSKGINLDLAFVQINSGYGLSLLAGKTKNPYKVSNKSELVWDGDYYPEGGSIQYAYEINATALDLRINQAWLSESKVKGSDLLQSGTQLNLTHKMGDISIGAGASYISIHNEDYDQGLSGTTAFDDDSFGNSSITDDADQTIMATGMTLVNPYIEVAAKGSLPWTAYAEYVQNTEADELNKGFALGLSLGKAKKPMTMALKYIYKEIQKDAVYGTLTDSDFSGGGTNGSGHELGAKLALMENTFFGISHFLNYKGTQPLLGEGHMREENLYNKTQIDLVVKF